jgi:hypothetical protein
VPQDQLEHPRLSRGQRGLEQLVPQAKRLQATLVLLERRVFRELLALLEMHRQAPLEQQGRRAHLEPLEQQELRLLVTLARRGSQEGTVLMA